MRAIVASRPQLDNASNSTARPGAASTSASNLDSLCENSKPSRPRTNYRVIRCKTDLSCCFFALVSFEEKMHSLVLDGFLGGD